MDIWRNNVIMLIFIALKKYFIIFITRRDWNMHERSLGWIYTPRKSEVIIYRRLNVKQWIISQKIGPLERSWGETKSCTKKKKTMPTCEVNGQEEEFIHWHSYTWDSLVKGKNFAKFLTRRKRTVVSTSTKLDLSLHTAY